MLTGPVTRGLTVTGLFLLGTLLVDAEQLEDPVTCVVAAALGVLLALLDRRRRYRAWDAEPRQGTRPEPDLS